MYEDNLLYIFIFISLPISIKYTIYITGVVMYYGNISLRLMCVIVFVWLNEM